MMQELLAMLERVEADSDTGDGWKAKIDWKYVSCTLFPSLLLFYPLRLFPQAGPNRSEKWCSLYTREEVKNCLAAGFESLARVNTIYFREPIVRRWRLFDC